MDTLSENELRAIITVNTCVYPKSSAWAVHLHVDDGASGAETDLTGGVSGSTDNRVLLYGLIEGLERLPAGRNARITVRSGFAYLGKLLAKGFLDDWAGNPDRSKRVFFPDADLWARLRELLAGREVSFHLIGPDETDEVYGRLAEDARAVARRNGLPQDTGAYVYILS